MVRRIANDGRQHLGHETRLQGLALICAAAAARGPLSIERPIGSALGARLRTALLVFRGGTLAGRACSSSLRVSLERRLALLPRTGLSTLVLRPHVRFAKADPRVQVRPDGALEADRLHSIDRQAQGISPSKSTAMPFPQHVLLQFDEGTVGAARRALRVMALHVEQRAEVHVVPLRHQKAMRGSRQFSVFAREAADLLLHALLAPAKPGQVGVHAVSVVSALVKADVDLERAERPQSLFGEPAQWFWDVRDGRRRVTRAVAAMFAKALGLAAARPRYIHRMKGARLEALAFSAHEPR